LAGLGFASGGFFGALAAALCKISDLACLPSSISA